VVGDEGAGVRIRRIKKLGGPVNSVDTGDILAIEHCSHCSPYFWWVVNEAGKAPEFVYKGFPQSGRVIMSKAKIIVMCGRCAIPIDFQPLTRTP